MGYLQKLSYCSETLDITSEGFGEMSEGDSADTCAGKFPLHANSQACADGE